MKTIAELYNEVIASEELKKEFLSLKPEEVEGFAEKYGCKATLEEIKAYITERNTASGDLSDDELDQVAGGKSVEGDDILASIIATVLCGAFIILSVAWGKCGTAIEGEGMLCGE